MSKQPASPYLSGTVLDNLQPGAPLQSKISTTLNATLRSQLVQAATTAKLPVLVVLINSLPDVDLAAVKDLSLQAFVKQHLAPIVSSDATMKAAVDDEITKLPRAKTVSSALKLTAPVATQPQLTSIVRDARLTSLLSASTAIGSDAQARFVSLYQANTGPLPAFWTRVASDPDLGPLVPQLQLSLQLGTLTSYNPDLVQKLIAQVKPTSIQDLTSLSQDQLVELMTSANVQVPASIATTTTPATISQYAASMIATLKQAFPMVYVAKSFNTSSDATNQTVGTFLSQSSGFDFATTQIDSYLTANPAAVANMTGDQVSAFTGRLKAAQRVFRVVPDGDTMQSLIQANLDSAYEIATTPSGSFVKQYSPLLGGDTQAQQIYATAANITGATSLIIRQAQEGSSILLPNVIPGSQAQIAKALSAIPNWQALFGTTSTCQCSECRAIDGPAAYLVSLLEFLRKINTGGNTPLDVLIGSASTGHGNISVPRRPDIAYLKLNCANADTALPYIDLVNEILETYVANNKQLLAASAQNTPTDAKTSVLDVTPEYMQSTDAVAAYTALNAEGIVYPYSLPFDRYLFIVRTYLDALGIGLYPLMQAFASFLNPDGTEVAPLPLANQLASESLLISLPEFSLITNQDFSGNATASQSLAACFGYGATEAQSTWQGAVSTVSAFLNQTGLPFNDLVKLLGTQYLNPNHLDPANAATITLPAHPCDITSMQILNADEFLRPLPPFLRLLKKLGWTIAELDYALRSFGITTLVSGLQLGLGSTHIVPGLAHNFDVVEHTDGLGDIVHIPPFGEGAATTPVAPPESPIFIPSDFIPIAAQIQQLCVSLSLSVSHVVSLWADIDTDGRSSPFIKLFQNKVIVNPPDADLRLLYSVPLASIPKAPPSVTPDGLAITAVHYDTATRQLQFSGSMTDAQLDQLLDWAGTDDNTVLAVNLLYSQRWYQGIDVVKPSFQILRHGPIGFGGILPSELVSDYVRNHINTILSALRIGASDLVAIRLDTGSLQAGAEDEDRLSLANLSAFQRYAILARSLGLAVPDLITLKNLTGLQPFTLASGAKGPKTDPMVQFVAAAQQVAASQFTAPQLAYLYGPVSAQTGSLAPLQTTQDAVMATILTGLQSIATANAYAPDPMGVALRKKLAVLIPAQAQLDATMALIAGTAVYTADLAELPAGVNLPVDQQVSFVLTATLTGSITAGDTLTLTLSSGTAGATPIAITYSPVLASDTLPGIASALAAQINADASLAAAGVTATIAGAVINITTPTGWTLTPSTGTSEQIATSGLLVCNGPLSSAAATALVGAQGAPFSNQVWSLYDQAQSVLTENLGFLVPQGPFSVPVNLTASITLPPGQVTFNPPGHAGPGTATLACSGPMLDSTRTALLAISGEASYTVAINNLYAQAWDASSTSVTQELIDATPGSPAADRYGYVLAGLLTYLTNTQSRNLVKQTLAQALSMDPSVVELLIEGNVDLGWPNGLLPSSIEPTQPAITDFLGGLTGNYYTSGTAPTPSGLGTTQQVAIDAGVSLDQSLLPTTGVGCAVWQGKLLAPTTSAYSFAVPVTGAATATLTIGGQPVTLCTAVSPMATVNLTAGQLYDISLELDNISSASAAPSGPTSVALEWCVASAPLSAMTPIPALCFMPSDANGAYPALALLYRLAVLIDGFSMTATEIAWFSSHGGQFAGIDPSSAAPVPFSLPALASVEDSPALFNQWQRLDAYYTLKASLPTNNTTLVDVFAAATAAEPLAQIVQTIANATGWDATNLQTLAGSISPTPNTPAAVLNFTAADFSSEIPLVKLATCLGVCSSAGVSAEQLFTWANIAPNSGGVSPYMQAAQDIQNTVKAKYSDSSWLSVGKPLNDAIRQASASALIANILYRMPIAAYSTVDDLYGYFLIDVEMCTCMETSRIVQASAAVQLFVQRCLLNLEPDVPPSVFTSLDIDEWNQWRKNYRVWQAATEVFLYPENWLDPTLRPNPTPFFQTMETALQQGDVTENNVKAAFEGYLESLQQVARLKICGLYTENDSESGRSVTHVIGRTFTSPHVYFYRTLDNITYAWSPWSQISADIAGDTLIPVIWNRRLFLFWPVYNEVTDPASNAPPASTITSQSGNNGQSSTGTPPATSGQKSLQIQLAYSEYKSGAWTSKQVTHDYLAPELYRGYITQLDQSSFTYSARPNGDGLKIDAYTTNDSLLYQAAKLMNQVVVAWTDFENAGIQNSSNLNPGSSAWTNIQQAAQTAQDALDQLKPFLSASDYTAQKDDIQSVLTVLQDTQAYSLTVAANNVQTTATYYQTLMGEDLNLTAFIGDFYFDGSQGFVDIAASSINHANISSSTVTILDGYGLNTTPTIPGNKLSYQDIDLSNPVFSLGFLDSADTPNVLLLLGAAYGSSPAFTVTLPQQYLPSYALDLTAESSQNVAFYTDRRRTYFVANSAAPAAAPLQNASLAGLAIPGNTFYQAFYFFNHYHPWAGEFIKLLNWNGISSLLSPSTQALTSENPPSGATAFDFATTYTPSGYVSPDYPEEVVAFDQISGTELAATSQQTSPPAGDGAYSLYNWEVFFHIPFMAAIQLSENQQFDDAEKWFRYIFNPTQDPNATLPQGYQNGSPNCYWNFQPLNAITGDQLLAELLFSASGAPPSPIFQAQMNAWEQSPFEPDVIAQMRPVAYQKAVVMKYIDHLIRRGDYCFRQNTRESINESIQYYILADQILGKKPIVIAQPGTVLDQTYYQLLTDDGGIYGLGNANVQLENAFPFVIPGTFINNGKPGGKISFPTTPYFCTPDNPTLLGYYDKVADRLYKIRHCMNIQGQVEQLALFAPPIDPGMLIAAEAAGVDLSSVLNDINAAVPHYRFSYMLSKALDLCSELRSLGGALLSAFEKSDAEGLSVLRAGQEVTLLQAVLQIKNLQVQEATANYAGLQASQAVATARQSYYQGLVQGGLSSYETGQVAALAVSEVFKQLSQMNEAAASALAIIPQYNVGINGVWGSPAVGLTMGGQQLSEAARAAAGTFASQAEAASFAASMLGMMGNWDRRSSEWQYQLEAATLELTQITQQLAAANFRIQIATQDVTNQNLQIANSQAILSTLKSKFTNKDLYQWMVSQISTVYFQCYQMAYDLARRAEACYRFELGIKQSSYIQFGYWDSMKKGLMSGEKLLQDLKRLEVAYIDQNLREYEISKSISLLLLDPWALVSLKLNGLCLINLPEAYFDMDYPGHYMRRIRSVSLTIPCVTGPYTSVNCTLVLLQSKIRIDNSLPHGSKSYAESPLTSDPRFNYNFSATESIATSTAQNDSGLFEVNFRDERYLPFEGSGAVSQWQLVMPPDCNAFDFETITDVILNLRYSARSGGDSLRAAARSAAVLPPAAMQSGTSSSILSPAPFPKQTNLQRYFSLRYEFPTEWYKLLNVTAPASAAPFVASMQINLGNDRFPFQYRSSTTTITITSAQFVILFTGPASDLTLMICPGASNPAAATPLTSQPSGTPPIGSIASPPQPTAATSGGPKCWILGSSAALPDNVSDILMVCTYSI